MAYMDDMALEREKSKQAMLEGKTPLLGADTTAQLHALGVSLGIVPPGTPPSQMTQLIEGLLKGPGKVKVDEAKPLQVQPLVGKLASLPADPRINDDSTGNTIANMFSGAKDSSLKQMLKQQQNQPPVPTGPPQTSTGPGASVRDAARRGRTMIQPQEAVPEGKGQPARVSANARLEGVSPQIVQSAKEWAQLYHDQNGQYSVTFTSGKRSGDPREHGRGNAFDMQLIDRKTGVPLENYRTNDPKTFKAYQDYANGYHQYLEANYPELAKNHRWGGYFSGDRSKYGSLDQMHHDFAGDRIGMAGGSWKDGLSPAQAKLFPGLVPGGGLAGRPPMTAGKPAAVPTVAAKPAPLAAAAPAAGGSNVLAEQRAANKAEALANPALRERMAAIMLLESSTPEGRQGTAEAIMNRVNAKGQSLVAGLDPAYHKDYMIDNKPKYQAALNKIRSDPQLQAQLYGEQDKAFAGSNVSNLATDYSSGATAAKGRTNSTPTYASPDGQQFFRKDVNPNEHGAGNVTANKNWHAKTTAAIGQPSTAAPQATPQPAPQVAPAPAGTPAPVASAPAAAAPVPPAIAPPATAAAKPAPQVNPAHALLDTKIIDLVKQGAPDRVGQIPASIAGKTLREAMNMPLVGGAVAAKAKEFLGASGVTPEQFDQAVKEGAPKPGKRSALEGLPQYAAADTGTMSDALPEQQPTAEAAGVAAPTEEVTAPAPGTPSEAPAVGPEAPSEAPLETPPFDPEGTDYDAAGALKAGLGPDDTGHWPSRDPQSGTLLKGRGHETWPKTVEGERAAGMEITQREDGRYQSQPQVTPEIAKALEDAVKPAEEPAAPAAQPNALPVLPSQDPSPVKTGAGGLSMAPPGLNSIPSGGVAPTLPGSQGGSIAMAGMLPPIQNAVFSSPLIDQQAATNSAFGTSNLSPIPWQTLGGWGWGGGSNIGAGFDWGGGFGNSGAFDFAGGFTPPTIG